MVGYGVGPQAIRVLRTHWGRITMVAKVGGYHSPPFKGFCRVTKGKPLSTTIFNMIVDAFMHHWVTVVEEEEAGPEVSGRSIERMAVHLYYK